MRPVANKKIQQTCPSPDSGRLPTECVAGLTEHLATGGFRFTHQRQKVYDVLLGKRDHPTAEEVFIRAKKTSPNISMATVYNCLTALVKCGLVKQVALERGASRFCPNMHEHCHFYCDACDSVFDIDLAETAGIPLPKGFTAERFDIAIHGRCPNCSKATTEISS
jgi:Fur family peroxide stress response transcriptional regulator